MSLGQPAIMLTILAKMRSVHALEFWAKQSLPPLTNGLSLIKQTSMKELMSLESWFTGMKKMHTGMEVD